MQVQTISSALIFSTFFIIITASSVFSQQPVKHPCAKTPDKEMVCNQTKFKDLNLTEEQRIKLHQLREANQPLRKKHREELKELRLKIKEELTKDSPDRAALKECSRNLAALHERMADEMTEHLLKAKGILSKEQFEKLLNFDFIHEMHNKNSNPGKTRPHESCPPDQIESDKDH